DAGHAGDAFVVVDPDDADGQEAGGVGQVRGPEVDQGSAEVLVGAGADADLEHQQGGGDREHAVRERLHARGAAVLHAAIFAAASDADGVGGKVRGDPQQRTGGWYEPAQDRIERRVDGRAHGVAG